MKEGGCSGVGGYPTGSDEEQIKTLPEVWWKQATPQTPLKKANPS
jgi:hypothetical protein